MAQTLAKRGMSVTGLRDTVILYAPQYETMAKELAKELNIMPADALLCTRDLSTCPSDEGEAGGSCAVFWDTFPSSSGERDPNVKVLHTALVGKHVVLLLSQDDTTAAFAQLSLLLWLQRFLVPDAEKEHADAKWKNTVTEGAFTVQCVASLHIVIPWYRYCQMERTSRWTRTNDEKKPWDNKQAAGAWLDIPTAQMYASLISADPPPLPVPTETEKTKPPPLPPKHLLLLDIHDDLKPSMHDPKGRPVIEHVLSNSGKWANPKKPYELATGTGTFFASVFSSFLASQYKQMVKDIANVFIIFPDEGAFRRFETMVLKCLDGIAVDHVLYIEKSRTGTATSQVDILFYMEKGEKKQREKLPANAQVLIPDDFTNSGGTLFGAGTIVRKHAEGDMSVSAFVTHFVAKYERSVVDKFVAKLYSEDGKSDLDHFFTSDSVACSVAWLNEEVAKRAEPKRVTIVSAAPVVASWLRETANTTAAAPIS